MRHEPLLDRVPPAEQRDDEPGGRSVLAGAELDADQRTAGADGQPAALLRAHHDVLVAYREPQAERAVDGHGRLRTAHQRTADRDVEQFGLGVVEAYPSSADLHPYAPAPVCCEP